jgi:hypothetical protein
VGYLKWGVKGEHSKAELVDGSPSMGSGKWAMEGCGMECMRAQDRSGNILRDMAQTRGTKNSTQKTENSTWIMPSDGFDVILEEPCTARKAKRFSK